MVFATSMIAGMRLWVAQKYHLARNDSAFSGGWLKRSWKTRRIWLRMVFATSMIAGMRLWVAQKYHLARNDSAFSGGWLKRSWKTRRIWYARAVFRWELAMSKASNFSHWLGVRFSGFLSQT